MCQMSIAVIGHNDVLVTDAISTAHAANRACQASIAHATSTRHVIVMQSCAKHGGGSCFPFAAAVMQLT